MERTQELYKFIFNAKLNGVKILVLIALLFISHLLFAKPIISNDELRNRHIPLEIYSSNKKVNCTVSHKCPVAILSAGYGVAHTDYSFIATTLIKNGYLVVAIQHELDGDPPLASSGNFIETRRENWERGAQTIRFVQGELKKTFLEYDFDHVMLIGHSNGGDISAWLASKGDDFITAVVTLDNRRAPLPHDKSLRVFSIRASDFEADEGVLPDVKERNVFAICIVKIPHAEHNDLTDAGPRWLKTDVQTLLAKYVKGEVCPSLD